MTEALLAALQLKAVDRAGWTRVGIARPESVAAHSWGVGWLVLALLPDSLDRQRALTYALLHDLAEAEVGDITPHDGIPRHEKHRRERAALAHILAPLGARGEELLEAWDAYEARQDAEAVFVHQLDRLDMALQATAYARHGHDTDEFVATARAAIDHPTLTAVLEALTTRP